MQLQNGGSQIGNTSLAFRVVILSLGVPLNRGKQYDSQVAWLSYCFNVPVWVMDVPICHPYNLRVIIQ
jgi:hypothetical protein